MGTRTGLIAATSATIVAAALTAACGQPQAQPGGGCRSGPVQVTDADNGKALCVTPGSSVVVLLRAPEATGRWSTVESDSDALVALKASGAVGPADATSMAFTAKHAGTVHLSSSRPSCPGGTGHVTCHSVVGYTVTVTVR
jgi:hypothetical protein